MKARAVLATAAILGLAMAFPGVSIAQTATQDSAVGNVTWSASRPNVANFDVDSGPLGENPTGPVGTASSAGVFSGTATCLTVTGSRATIGFADTLTPTDAFEGGFLFVEDNLTPPAIGEQDNIRFEPLADAPTTCPVNTVVYDLDPFGGESVISGDLTVADAQPPGRMVGKGGLSGGGKTASYAYIVQLRPGRERERAVRGAFRDAAVPAHRHQQRELQQRPCRDDAGGRLRHPDGQRHGHAHHGRAGHDPVEVRRRRRWRRERPCADSRSRTPPTRSSSRAALHHPASSPAPPRPPATTPPNGCPSA